MRNLEEIPGLFHQHNMIGRQSDTELEYFNGGMTINFSKNKMSFEVFKHLSRLLISFSGLRSISLSN